MTTWDKDLVVLVADKNMEFAVRGILSRPRALGIRDLAFDVYVHPERDPGCRSRGHDFLRPMAKTHNHALMMFDRVGSGQDSDSRNRLEEIAVQQLRFNGWDDRAEVIVLDPELEVWVWADSPGVAKALGWKGRSPDLRTWLRSKRLWLPEDPKPPNPKEVAEAALLEVRKPRSSAIYGELASTVSLAKCSDPAFLKLRETLRQWFRDEASHSDKDSADR